MAAVFNQLLGSNQSKTGAASLVISPSSKTVTVGRTIFVAYAGDNGGSAFGVTDNLGNIYSLVKEQIQTTGGVKTQLWSAPVTTGGSITSITISWTTNVTAKAAVAGEFSNFGSLRLTSSNTNTISSNTAIQLNSSFVGELWVGAHGVEDDVAFNVGGTSCNDSRTIVNAGSDGTTGGGSASNISVAMSYMLMDADGTNCSLLLTQTGGSQNGAGAGAIYNAAGGGGGRTTKNTRAFPLGMEIGMNWVNSADV